MGSAGHMNRHPAAPRRFEENCSGCGEYGDISRFCVTLRGPEVVCPHVTVVTSSSETTADTSGQQHVTTILAADEGHVIG